MVSEMKGGIGMFSKVEGRNYVLLPYGERQPRKLNKKRTDAMIDKLLKACNTISDALAELYESDYDAYEIFARAILEYDGRIRFDGGRVEVVDDIATGLRCLKEQLETHDDEIRPFEEVLLLEDLGFVKDIAYAGRYERSVKSSEDEDIVEEVIRVIDENTDSVKYLHRVRTIEWMRTDYGRSSRSIVYKNCPVSKRLARAISNTFGEDYRAAD